MREGAATPQINVSKIQGSGGIAGALFAVISTVIFLIGIPALRYFFPAAIVLGCGVALIIHFIRHETPGAPWILSATEKKTEAPSEKNREHKGNPGQSVRILLDRPTTC